MIKALLLDIDGTLAEGNRLHVRAWAEVFRNHDLQIADDTIHSQIGKGADVLVPALIPAADEKLAEGVDDEHGAM